MKAKKAQLSGDILIYGIAVVAGVAILLFGVQLFGKFMQGRCSTELNALKNDIAISAEGLANIPNSAEDKNYDVACGIEEIYFIDRENALPEMFADKPEIENSLEGFGKENAFIYSNGGLMESFSAGDIALSFPFFRCIKPTGGKLSFSIVGTPNGVDILAKTPQESCNPVPSSRPSQTDLNDVFALLSDYTKLKPEILEQKFISTQQSISQPHCQKTQNGERLNVFIGHNRKLANATVYHFLPSCLSKNLTDIENQIEIRPQELEDKISKDWLDYANGILRFKINSTGEGNGIVLLIYDFNEDDKIPAGCTDYCNVTAIDRELCAEDADCTTLCRSSGDWKCDGSI